MNTRSKLLVAASLLMCAVHQPVLAAKSATDSNVANNTVVATVPMVSTPAAGPATVTTDPEDPTVPMMPSIPTRIDVTHLVKGAVDKTLPVFVVVDKQKHFTHVLQVQNQVVTEVLCVQNSTGKASTPTPEGRSVITQKQLDPVWKPPVSIDPLQRAVQPWSKTHRNPLGVANLRLSMDHGMIALHGTNEPKQIGKNVSHGCIRHLNADILKVSAIVSVGTPVYIVSSMDHAKVAMSDAMSQPHAVPHTITRAAVVPPQPAHKS